jgi:hypothetical protein
VARYDEATLSKIPEQVDGNPGDMLGFRHWGDDIAGRIVAARLQAFNPNTLDYEDVLVDDASGGIVTSGEGGTVYSAPVTVNATASGNTTVIAAPGSSLSLYVCKMSVHNRDSTNRLVSLQDGAGGTTRWRAELIAEGGGSLIDFGSAGWQLTANTLLNVNLDSAGSIDVNVSLWYSAAA